MFMYIHSYLSKNEVIGLLGGKHYETNITINGVEEKRIYIVISKIYPAESCTHSLEARKVNCEISDEDHIRISDQMEKDGVRKLAWYHSHPLFEVNPSITDLFNH